MATTLSKSAANRGGLQWIRQVHSRLADHLQHKTTDLMAPAMQSDSAAQLYFAPERDNVVRAAPAFVLPSCVLPAGHVVAEYLPSNQTPILIHRDSTTGEVRAYVNQCRHRGSALISSQTATVTHPQRLKGAALTCPYHAWTYDVRNGNLKKVPGEQDGFPCLDKSSLGLKQIACTETAGGIWVGGDQLRAVDKWSLDEIDDELNELWLDPTTYTNDEMKDEDAATRLVGYREWKLQANWQLLVETFLESYHVQFLHQDTLGLVTHGNRMVAERLDTRSLRHTVPLSNFDPTSPPSSMLSSTRDEVSPKDPFFSQTTTTYFLFPNVAISLFKRFAIFLSIVPDQVTRNGKNASDYSRVRAWGVTHATAEGEDLLKQQRDFESVVKGIEEDWECTEDIQRGLRPETVLQHGRFEGNNIDFLRNVGEISDLLLKQQ